MSAFVAHNGRRFDVPFLLTSMERAGIDGNSFLKECGIEYQIDTMQVIGEQKSVSFRNRRLGTVYKCLTGKPLKNAHNALVDSEALLPIIRNKLLTTDIENQLRKL